MPDHTADAVSAAAAGDGGLESGSGSEPGMTVQLADPAAAIDSVTAWIPAAACVATSTRMSVSDTADAAAAVGAIQLSVGGAVFQLSGVVTQAGGEKWLWLPTASVAVTT